MRTKDIRRLEKEKQKLNLLLDTARKAGVPIHDVSVILEQSEKIDLLLFRIQKEKHQ